MARTGQRFTNSQVTWVVQGSAGDLVLSETTTPVTIGTAGQLYVKADHNLYFLNALGVETLVITSLAGEQIAIQPQDEGVNLGTSGTFNTLNFTGAGVVASRVGNVVTVNVPSSGGSGLNAYGYAAGQSDDVIGADADVVFDLGATPFPNFGFTSVPAPAGTAFVIATTGAYEFNFFIVGTHATAATTSLEFALYLNGSIATVAGNAFEYRSNQQGGGTDIQVCRGQGIIQLTAGDSLTVHNRTNLTTDTVTVTSIAPGGEAGVNRSFTLKKLN